MGDRQPRARLVVMAKEPRPGAVKTRLAPAVGLEGAARLYAAFLADTAARLGAIEDVERVLAVWPPHPDAPWLDRYREGFTCVAQRGDGLAARMEALTHDALEVDGCGAVVIVGSDAPTLPVEYVAAAFDTLRQGADAVLGPGTDGGYYAIGLRRVVPGIFDLPMSTSDVLAATLAALRRGASRPVLLPAWADVDVPADFERLRIELADPVVAARAPCTLAALVSLTAVERA